MNALNAPRPLWRAPLIKAAAALALLCWVANPAAARTVTITITGADCSRLVAHVPALGVEYAPGVDVRGRPVAPADLGGRPKMKFPDTIEIPVYLDGLPANSNLWKLDDAKVGTVAIRVEDGRAWFNGQPLTSDEHHAMARACHKLGPSGPP
ncbi:MAG: hypothetical protein O7A66_08400 [Alphaproteobacteria bacterium]|nr:hypothetical protein [Alphaproteobacteria bacterium]